jgi:predicted HTH transcriptional regulator
MSNPYSFAYLNSLVGQQETQRLEFKSIRELSNDNSQKRGKFISEQIVPTVSAFLNTDGGQLVIGIEEKKRHCH